MSEPASKTALRRAAAARRAEAAGRAPLAALTLAARLPRGWLPPAGGVVAGYQPIRSEIDPWPLLRRLALLGARIALPCAPARGTHAALIFRAFSAAEALAPGAFGVREPPARAEALAPDLVLVPLLAFDAAGRRLGYGAGHYDRTLEALRASGRGVGVVGLAYAAQEVERLPAEAHDQPLDAILTERGFWSFRRGGIC